MISRYQFVGTPLELTEREVYYLHKYKKKGRGNGTIVPLRVLGRAFELDLAALATPVLLDCMNCHLAHGESCCEGGFPFPPAAELLPVLNEHAGGIAERHLPEGARQHIAAHGLYAEHLETAGHPTVGTFEGNCLFCRVEGNGPACAAHRYALEAGLEPHELKPLSCLLYPLDLIADEQGRVFVTALTERTADFSRWGADYRLDFLCANKQIREQLAAGEADAARENIRRDLPTDVFALERYKPAYREGQATLQARFGEAVWLELAARMEEFEQKGGC